jgi:hypothetical protein
MIPLWQKHKPALLLGASLVLALLFVAENAWQLKRTGQLARAIRRAPPAVNLSLHRDGKELLLRCFPANPDGDWYAVNRFDLAPHIGPGGRVNLQARLDGIPVSARLMRLADVDALLIDREKRTLVFFIARPADGMRQFARLLAEAPQRARALRDGAG